MAALCALVSVGNLVLVDAVVTVYWMDEFGISESYAGTMYALQYLGIAVPQFIYPFVY